MKAAITTRRALAARAATVPLAWDILSPRATSRDLNIRYHRIYIQKPP